MNLRPELLNAVLRLRQRRLTLTQTQRIFLELLFQLLQMCVAFFALDSVIERCFVASGLQSVVLGLGGGESGGEFGDRVLSRSQR